MDPTLVSAGMEAWFATIPGEAVRIRIHSRSVGGRFTVVESLALPGTATPLHTHREDEVFQILEGVLTFAVGDARFEAGPGAVVVVPAGAAHAWCNRGHAPARALVTFTPGGIEGLFPEIAGLAPEQLAALAARYGSAVVGPPIAV